MKTMDAAITPLELAQRLAAFPPPTLIDVRRQAAFEQDRNIIPDAIRRLPEAVEAWDAEIEPWRPVVVHCVRGHEVSQDVAVALRARGFDARYLAGGLEQWRAFDWRASVERAFVNYARTLERKFNGGTYQHGMFAAFAAITPPVLLAAVAFWLADAVHWSLGLLVNTIVLYFLMGFRRFSHAISAIVAALQAGDLPTARRVLGAWRGGSTADL